MRKTWLSWKTAFTWRLSRARRFQIVTEGLFDHHGHLALFRLRHALSAQVLDDPGKKLRRGGQIEQPVAANPLFLRNTFQFVLQARIAARIVELQAGSSRSAVQSFPALGSSASAPPCSTMPARISAANSSPSGRRATPTMANSRGSSPACSRWKSAGSSLRLVRSPDAPKITRIPGSGILSTPCGTRERSSGRTFIWIVVTPDSPPAGVLPRSRRDSPAIYNTLRASNSCRKASAPVNWMVFIPAAWAPAILCSRSSINSTRSGGLPRMSSVRR